MSTVFRTVLAAFLLWSVAEGASQAQTGTAGNINVQVLSLPPDGTVAKGILIFSQRGLASDWAKSAGAKGLAQKIDAAMMIVSGKGGDQFDEHDSDYPNMCGNGTFNYLPTALKMLADTTKRPELANAPLVTFGHSHGGDYWNWYNACHPDRTAVNFVHASGGVNYNAGALKVPVLYELGSGDLIENGSKMPRAGMFVNRAKGAPMFLVIGEGGHDTQPNAQTFSLIYDMLEATWRLRVPAAADPSKGPVALNDINEMTGGYWVGDFYTKEISTWADFKGNKATTSFLPTQALAERWKMTGPALPASIKLPTDDCGWCGHPKDEPKASNGNPAPPAGSGTPTPPASADAGAPPDPGTSTPPATTPPTSTPPATTPPTSTPPTPVNPAPRSAGGCSYAGGSGSVAFLGLLGALTLLTRRRRRS
jgi:MYXO-CTERM domain-containing protein